MPEQEADEATRVLAQVMETRVLSSPGFECLIGADVDKPFDNWPDAA